MVWAIVGILLFGGGIVGYGFYSYQTGTVSPTSHPWDRLVLLTMIVAGGILIQQFV